MMQITQIYAADQPILQVSAENIYLKAGQENTIKIVLKNTGDYKIFDIEAFLTSPISGLTVISKANQVISEIDADKSKSYEPIIYVDQNLPLGAYSLSLMVNYGRTGVILQSTVNVPVGVIISEAFTPNIVYSPTLEKIDVVSGTENNLEFRFASIQNSTINDIKIILNSPTSSITITNNIITSINELTPGSSFTINPTISVLEGTPLGAYTLSAIVSYQDENGNRFHQSFALPINIATAAAIRNTIVTIEDIRVMGESILPGDIFNIEIEVKCSGAVAYDLLSSLGFTAASPISPISPSIRNLGDLETGETTKVTYTLLSSGSIAAGQYPITATITYTSSRGVTKSITETFTILVDGLVDFDLLDTPSTITPAGEVGEIEADLLLIGTESVDFVSIGVIEDNYIQRVSGSDEYIGAVDPDSPIPFDVNYRVDDDAPEGEHDLQLQVKYRDHLNREREETIRLSIEIGEPENNEPQPQQTGFWVWLRRLFGLGP